MRFPPSTNANLARSTPLSRPVRDHQHEIIDVHHAVVVDIRRAPAAEPPVSNDLHEIIDVHMSIAVDIAGQTALARQRVDLHVVDAGFDDRTRRRVLRGEAHTELAGRRKARQVRQAHRLGDPTAIDITNQRTRKRAERSKPK